MKKFKGSLALAVAVTGAAVCLAAISGFILKIARNGLPWGEGSGVRDHYVAVGGAYGAGFMTGFFLCFFLVLIALVTGVRFERRLLLSGLFIALMEVHSDRAIELERDQLWLDPTRISLSPSDGAVRRTQGRSQPRWAFGKLAVRPSALAT